MPPKKSKKIVKQPKADPKEEKEEAASEDIFSESFRDRLDKFSGLTKEVLALKAEVEGGSTNEEVAKRRERVSEKIEEASSGILKDELNSLEGWIGEQKEKLAEEIKRINKAYEENRNTLEATGSFKDDEIKDQLSTIQKRAQEKQDIFDSYEELLAKSKSIYS